MNKLRANISQASRLLKSIANESRLLILCILHEKPMTVGVLNEHVKISQSALSQHLNMLKLARLVDSNRKGTAVEYYLTSKEAKAIISTLMGFYNIGNVSAYQSQPAMKGLAVNEEKASFGAGKVKT